MSSKEPSVNDRVSAPSTESKDSAAPLLNDSSAPSTRAADSTIEETTAKPRKRDFWKLGKKLEDDKSKEKVAAVPKSPPAAVSPLAGMKPVSPMRSPEFVGGS